MEKSLIKLIILFLITIIVNKIVLLLGIRIFIIKELFHLICNRLEMLILGRFMIFQNFVNEIYLRHIYMLLLIRFALLEILRLL